MNTHGLSRINGKHTRLYGIWSSIKRRCFDKNFTHFNRYGGRGITICDEWRNDFKSFYDWSMANGYHDGLTIDRINNDGNYEPSNCRWTTKSIQTRNTKLIHKHNTSGFRGVSFYGKDKHGKNKYQAHIKVNKKGKTLGYFKCRVEAAHAYDNFVRMNGLEHTLNFC